MKKGVRIIGNVVLQAAVFLLLLLSLSLLWVWKNYGNIGFEEIIFHLNMPLQGTAEEFIGSYIKTALCPAILLFFVELLVLYFSGKKRRRPTAVFWAAILTVWLGGILFAANWRLGLIDYIRNQIDQSSLIEEEYADPKTVPIRFPEKKRNLICIYMESAETSAQDKADGGVFDVNYIPEMTQIAKDNVSFSQSDLIEGASVGPASGWTIAGLVAETSGLPLKLFAYDDTGGGADNSMKKYAYFMPGAISLGEILEREGYHNYFLAGSNFKFGGRTNYFTQHGNYTIWDYKYARKHGWIPSDYKVWWGFEDEKLYSFARTQLKKLAAKDEPFNFSMLTVDTHHQNGYVCRLCGDTYDDQYANVWACASRQVNEFVEWIRQQDFYENTTVVIMGDHCSMDSDFYGDLTYDKHKGATVRKVYNAVVNPAVQPVKEKNRKFTTMDLFPTTLAALGAEIEGERLGLGTNLFSGEETLSEKYGYEALFGELNKKSPFYDHSILYP